MDNHIGLIKIQNNKLVAVQYYVSKFDRDLGDKINYQGTEYQVAVIGEDRNDVISSLNVLIKQQNKINRDLYRMSSQYQTARLSERNATIEFNKMIAEAMQSINF